MKKLFTFVVLAVMSIVTVFAVNSGAAEEAEPTATLNVSVTDEQGNPIDEANVFFNGLEGITTDAAGKSTITVPAADVTGKMVTVEVYKDGYEPFSTQANFTNGLTASVNAVLKTANASLTVTVMSEEEPVADATVSFMGKDYLTGDNGQATISGFSFLDVVGKTVPYSVYKDGYEPFDGEADFTEIMDAQAVVELEPSQATMTVKVVTGEDNDPIEGATVTYGQKEVITGENGEAKFTIPAPEVIGKTVPYTAYKDGYEFFEGEADFTEGFDAYPIASLVPAEAIMTVKVVAGEENDPIKGATVTCGDKEVVTGENGEAKFTLPAPEVIGTTVAYTVYKDGYEFFEGEADFTEGLETMPIASLEASMASLTVKVVTGEDNDPIKGATVTYGEKEVITGENGEAKFTIPAPEVIGKTVPYTAYKDGYEFFEGEADFTEGFDAYPIASLVPAVATMTVKVVAGEENDPIKGATVTCGDEEVVTGENGEAKFTLPAPEVIGTTVAYTVYKDGYEFFEGEADFTEGLETMPIASLEPAKATFTVQVFYDDEPVVDAYVSAMGSEAFADENGRAVLTLNGPDVIGKQITVTIYKDGFEPTEVIADFSETLEAYYNDIVELKAAEASLTIKVISGENVIGGAMVTFNGKDYISDENGDVKITDLNGPEYVGNTFPVTVYKDGYEPFEGEADFTETLEASLVAELIEAQATLTVKAITGDENDPVVGAIVTFQDKTYTTDENGECVIKEISGLEVLGEKVPVTVFKDGYEVFEGEADFSEGLEGYVIANLEAAEATLTVKVMVGEDPVEGAIVTFQEKDYTTDENGEVKIEGIDGPSVIGKMVPFTAYKDGYDVFNGKADFSEGLDAYMVAELVEAEATLTVKVVAGEDMDPIEGATVYLGETEAVTGENGEAKFAGLSALEVIGKMVDYSVYKDGYEPFEGKADFTETIEGYAIAQLIAAEATLTIKVITGDDVVEGAFVTFNNNEYYSDENGDVKITGLSAPEFIGKTFPVTVYKDGYEYYETKADFTETMEAFVIAELEAAKATLNVTVIDGEDPVADAVVTFMGQEYTTDENGRVVITGISAPAVIGQKIDITVTKPGYITYTDKADFSETMDAYVVVEFQKDDSAIESIFINGVDGDTKVYDLQGRRVLHPRKGQIYIVNGRKVLFK